MRTCSRQSSVEIAAYTLETGYEKIGDTINSEQLEKDLIHYPEKHYLY